MEGDGASNICRIELIGEPRLRFGDELATVKNRKALAILGLLAFSPSGMLSRERIIGLLWSERPPEQARGALRQTIYDLKQSLGPRLEDILVVGRSDLHLAAQNLVVDIQEIQAAIVSAERPPPGVAWHRLNETLFAGFEDLDPSFQLWLAVLRQSQGDRLLSQFERRLDHAATDEERRAWAFALQEADPTNEFACRCLMDSDAGRGDLGSAIRRYGILWDLLDEEYGTEPSNETQALAVRIKSATVETPAEPVRAAAVSEPIRIFVRPFDAYGIDPGLNYLTDGFRRDFLATLLPFRDWVIIEPSEPLDLAALHDAYVLEGAAYPDGDLLRLALTVKEASTGRYMWSDKSTLSLADWFQTCERLARRLAAALHVNLSADRLARLSAMPDVSLSIYDRWLRAQELLNFWTPEEEQRAEAIVRSILDEAPDFAQANTGLAQILNARHIVFPGRPKIDMANLEAVRHARRGAEKDPINAGAHLCLGWSLVMTGNHQDAIGALNAACELNPGNPRVLASAADALTLCGQATEALRLVDRSLELDVGATRLLWGYRVSVYLFAGEAEKAVQAAERSQNAIPLGGGYRAAALAALGRKSDAREAWKEYLDFIRGRWLGDKKKPDDAALAAWFLASPPMCSSSMKQQLAGWLKIAGAEV
ncbi:putative PEP-CTERM system TPR-repeat lipoprotein [Hartmannibacter diazotrophicus]|uniref:Putative PEP-CTERM system TPR-repeat lipoprotein n=1 Tax=Hartmannibacter diazotrophicus TaxID=1482074 RepID=A0A2C9D6Z3_9HYPH|nr:BTAD domain-containing putative transcriptional regulator [Hartmannibacter diazotrophicus]SON55918.1 putative PEP-CTERM system TPR-repeat lipoprotein [Hartmannibacter diazotrophicus]